MTWLIIPALVLLMGAIAWWLARDDDAPEEPDEDSMADTPIRWGE